MKRAHVIFHDIQGASYGKRTIDCFEPLLKIAVVIGRHQIHEALADAIAAVAANPGYFVCPT